MERFAACGETGSCGGNHRRPTARIAWERERLHLTMVYSFSYYGRGTIPPSPLCTRGAFSRVPSPLVILSVSDSEERTPSDSDGARRHEWRLGILSGDHRRPTARIARENGRLHLTVAHSFSYCGRGTIPPFPPLHKGGLLSRTTAARLSW